MKKLKIFILLLIICSSCKTLHDKNQSYNYQLSKLILSNGELKSVVDSTFNLEDKTAKVFKVLISRRDRFVRVTIYQLADKNQLPDYPSSYFTYNSNTFLCYDGSELITGKTLDPGFMSKLTKRIQTSNAVDGNVVQFDIAANKAIIMHVPAIDPYDINEHDIKFQPPNKPIH